MRNFLFSLIGLLMAVSVSATAQSTFNGAEATKKKYYAVYQLNSDDEAKIKATLKNMQNALADPRLKDKLELELVVHGGGVAAFKKGSPFEQTLMEMQKQGVLLVQCENTLRERKISKDELFPFISFTPSGNGELIIRQQQGWTYVHP